MGHINQKLFLTNSYNETPKRVLEIGSKNYGNTQDFRSLFDCEYVGLDMEEGEGVDVVHDLEVSPLDDQFDLIICCSVLEHVKRPWVVAKHIEQMSAGHVYISVPWVQRYHPYPDDYYRFSLSGLKILFEEMDFYNPAISTFRQDEFASLIDIPDADSQAQTVMDGRPYLPCFEIHTMGVKRGY